MSFHGGALGVIVAIVLFCRAARASRCCAFADIIACAVPIGLFFGRIANFINGELWGRVTDVPWAMVFPTGGPDAAPSEPALRGLPRRRSCCSSCSARCSASRRRGSGRASLTGVFLIGYGVARIIGEFFRQPDAQLGFLVCGIDHGPAAVAAAAARRRSGSCCARAAGAAPRREPRSRDAARAAHPRERAARRVADYMAVALHDPQHGYYATRDPLGAAGDFITAPEISQIFGELIGLWCADSGQRMGRPDPVVLVELGPGRGTLMADVLRAVARRAGFPPRAAAASGRDQPGAARARKRRALADAEPRWHDSIATLPDGPAAARRQRIPRRAADPAVRARPTTAGTSGWSRSARTARSPSRSRTRRRDAAAMPPALRDAAPGEHRARCARRPRRSPRALGARARRARAAPRSSSITAISPSACGDTLQAVRGHRRHDRARPIPASADLTAHVDFAAFAAAARPPARAPGAR